MSTGASSSTAEDEDSFSSSDLNLSNAPNTSGGLSSLPNDLRAALDEFRESWQRELQHSELGQNNESLDVTEPKNANHSQSEDDAQRQALAESLFQKAVQLEQRGKVYDALPFYRKAVQMVPDIEFKFYERNKLGTGECTTPSDLDGSNTAKKCKNDSRRPSMVETVRELHEKFQLELGRDYGGKLLLKNSDAAVVSTGLHISDLPPEILFYILRWVVSSHLDMRSLEQVAAVCKGFFLCARDEELWRLACLKVWGSDVGTIASESSVPDPPSTPVYNTWRQMFIERERVNFNGCYISKTTYLRMGENSFQDQFYRPVQLVEYFRYVRFLADGTVLMMTSADEPVQGVSKLKQVQQLRQEVLRGHYRLSGNTVTVVLKKTKRQSSLHAQLYMSRHRHSLYDEMARTTYCIEFRLTKSSKRRFNHLVWQHYSIKQVRNKVEVSSEFELSPTKYPPLWFSPVRSYSLDAEAPLV